MVSIRGTMLNKFQDEDGCCICGFKSNFLITNLSKIKTAHSKTSINRILKRLYVKASMAKESCEKQRICRKCLNKINDCDFAYTNALRIENELLEILKSRENKIENETEFIIKNTSNNDESIGGTHIEVTDSKNFESLESVEDEIIKDEIVIKNEPEESNSNASVNDEKEINEQHDDASEATIKYEIMYDESEEVVDDSNNEQNNIVEHYSEDSNDDDDFEFEEEFDDGSILHCIKCPETFNNEESYKEHLREHLKKKDFFYCEPCDKTFPNHTLFDVHQNIHFGKSEIECRYCSKVFQSKNAALRHNRIHSRVSKYQCELCGKPFIHYSSFKIHMDAHKDLRPFTCNICQKSFRLKAHLTTHMITHSGEKPFDCEHCGKKFSKRYNMEQHKKMHYPYAGIFCCRFCSEGFTKRRFLKEHILDKHYEIYEEKTILFINTTSQQNPHECEGELFLKTSGDEEIVLNNENKQISHNQVKEEHEYAIEEQKYFVPMLEITQQES